jgi:hypothetical protein
MLTQEEVKIKMGIDSTAVFSGIDKVSGYMDRWKTKRKTSEQEYTSWWSHELEKRSKAELEKEIEAASRRNRARALLRQRAANAELKIARAQAEQEKAAADFAAQQAAASRSAITLTSLRTLGGKAMSLLKANVYLAGAQVVAEIIPTWETIWNSVYGVDEAGTKRLEEATNQLRTIKDKAQEAGKELEDAFKKARYEDTDNLGKRNILLQDQANQKNEVKLAREQVDRLKAQLKFFPGNRDLIAQLGNAQGDLSKKELALFNTGRTLKEVNSKLTPDAVAQIFAQMLSDSIPDVYKLRSEITKQLALKNAFNRNGQLQEGMLAGVNAKMAMDLLGQVVVARSVSGLNSAAGALPGFGPLEDIKASLEAASAAAMSATIQRVKIVDIE